MKLTNYCLLFIMTVSLAGGGEPRPSKVKGASKPGNKIERDPSAGINGSFEVVKSGVPVNWYVSGTDPLGNFDVGIDNTEFKEGKQSLKFVVRKVDSTGRKPSPAFFNEFHDTKPGETYKISFWAKNAGSEFGFTARGVSAFKSGPGVVIKSKETIDEWRRFECTYTIPPKMWLRLELKVLQPGTFWIDDVQIVRVNESAK